MLPNFLIIGAMKSGTSSINNYLSQHDDIFMHPKKEINFFSTYNSNSFCLENGQVYADSISQYKQLFKNTKKYKIIGEASPSYLYNKNSSKIIKSLLPNVKILIVLRNPVDRAFSHYNFMVSKGPETLSFKEAIEVESDRINAEYSYGHYINRSLYYDQIKNYFDNFKAEQIKVLIFENFIKNPNKAINEIFSFLNLSNNNKIDFSKKYQVSGIPKNKLIHNFLVRPNFFKKNFRHLLPKFISDYLLDITRKNLIKPELDFKTRLEIKQYFKEDIKKTSNLLSLNLDDWLK